MKRFLKLPAGVIRLLLPLGRRLRQAWAYMMLAAQLRHAVPSSVVVLGTPEVHGTAIWANRCTSTRAFTSRRKRRG
jgi:hypothetical protein